VQVETVLLRGVGVELEAQANGPEADGRRASMLRLTERYCVVLQTLRSPPTIAVDHTAMEPVWGGSLRRELEPLRGRHLMCRVLGATIRSGR
jgi:hypothetical protein